MDRLQTQLQQIDSLDGKIGNLLGFGGALLAILAAVLALREDDIALIVWVLLGISGVCYSLMVIISICSYYTRGFAAGPKLEETWLYTRINPAEQMHWWAAESFTKCYEKNQGKVKWKVRAVNADVALIAFEAITLVVGLALISYG